MFRWPKTDDPLEWLLERLVDAVAGLIAALSPSRIRETIRDLSFTKWVVIGLFVAASLLVWDALTFQWLASLSHRFETSFPP